MSEQNQGSGQRPEEFPLGPGTTGRYVIVTAPASRIEEAERGVTALSDVAGVSPDETAEAVDDPENPLQAVVPERINYALQEGPTSEEWGSSQQRPFEEEYNVAEE